MSTKGFVTAYVVLLLGVVGVNSVFVITEL